MASQSFALQGISASAESQRYRLRIFDFQSLISDSFHVRGHSSADAITSHTFFGRPGGEVDLKQSDGWSKHSNCFKIFFDKMEFWPVAGSSPREGEQWRSSGAPREAIPSRGAMRTSRPTSWGRRRSGDPA